MSRRPRTFLRVLAPIVAAASLLTACAAGPAAPVPTPTSIDLSRFDPETDGNGLGLLSAAAARDVVLAAIGDAGDSVALVRFDDAGGRTLDARIAGSETRYEAQYTLDGQTTSIVVDGPDAWILPSPALAAAEGLAESWQCVAASDALVERWAPLTSARSLVEALTRDASGVGPSQDDAVGLLLGAQEVEGALTVSIRGRALPSDLVRSDAAGTVRATFEGWGEPVAVTPPGGC